MRPPRFVWGLDVFIKFTNHFLCDRINVFSSQLTALTNGNAQISEKARVGNLDLVEISEFERLSLADSFLAIHETILLQESLGKDDSEDDGDDCI
jgi:hypothetical protein